MRISLSLTNYSWRDGAPGLALATGPGRARGRRGRPRHGLGRPIT